MLSLGEVRIGSTPILGIHGIFIAGKAIWKSFVLILDPLILYGIKVLIYYLPRPFLTKLL